MPTLRICAKVLLVDETDRVLLFQGVDPAKPERPPWWFTVGGSLDPGETVAEAAIREVQEETGVVLDDVGPIRFERRVTFTMFGDDYDQLEHHFFVRTKRFALSSAEWTDVERDVVQDHRWWSVDELRATDEEVFPEDLADRLIDLLEND